MLESDPPQPAGTEPPAPPSMLAGRPRTRDAFEVIHRALVDEQQHRRENDDWVERERARVVVAANEWAEGREGAHPVSEVAVERVERFALGHSDYTKKFALYVAELVTLGDVRRPL